MSNNTTSNGVQDQIIVIERIFDAPRALVWKAWTDPQHLMRWWGPEHFTSPSAEMDVREGGKYLFCMESPEGEKYYSTGVFKEIVPIERLVFTDNFADEKGNVVSGSEYGMDNLPGELLVTVTFEDLGDKTKMTMVQRGEMSDEMKDMTRQGWDGSFDKLAQSVQTA